MHALLSDLFYAMYANLHHCVVFLVPLVPDCVTCGLKKTLLVKQSYSCQLGLGLSDVSGYFNVLAHE